MEPKLKIAVFVDYDNVEIGVKSTLRREFNVTVTLDALRERGDVVAKFAYANWGLMPRATRQMAENAVQMVQRNPSPRGDKNGGDINLALDALEMAFTHSHVNAFAIISGDSDFNPLVNKLKEYGKTVYIVGGRAFTSNILQQNCHEFISYESMIGDDRKSETRSDSKRDPSVSKDKRPRRRRAAATLDLARAMPLIKRTLLVLERRNVQPQLGLLKSTMLQLDSRFNERDYGASSFSELIDQLNEAGYVQLSGSGGQATIETKTSEGPEKALVSAEEALPPLRDVLESHRLEIEEGCPADQVEAWISEDAPDFAFVSYGFRTFAQLLNFAQDKLVVRVEPDEEAGLLVYLGEEFYPTATPERATESRSRRRPSRRRSSSPVLPGEKRAAALPDDDESEASAKQEISEQPAEKRSSELPGEKKSSGRRQERSSSALPDEKYASVIPDENMTSDLPGEKRAASASREKKEATPPREQESSDLPHGSFVSDLPGEKRAASSPRSRKASETTQEKKSTALPDEEIESALPAEKKASASTRGTQGKRASASSRTRKASASPREKKSTALPGEKIASDLPGEKRAASSAGEKKAPVRRVRRKKAAPKE